MPQRGHRQGRPGRRPHQVDPGPRRVRGRLSVQGLDAGRELAARLFRRSAPAGRHPGPPGSAPRAGRSAARTRRRSNSNRPISPACFRNTSRARATATARRRTRPAGVARTAERDRRANGVPATYDFRRPYGGGAGAAIPAAGGELAARRLLAGALRASTADRRASHVAQRACAASRERRCGSRRRPERRGPGARRVACGRAARRERAGRPALGPAARRAGAGFSTALR